MKTILFTAEKNGDIYAVKVGQCENSLRVAMATVFFCGLVGEAQR